MREICTSGSEGGWGGKPPWSTRPPKRRPEPSPPRRVKVSASHAKTPAELVPFQTPRPPAQLAYSKVSTSMGNGPRPKH